jgi:hypothetical protein
VGAEPPLPRYVVNAVLECLSGSVGVGCGVVLRGDIGLLRHTVEGGILCSRPGTRVVLTVAVVELGGVLAKLLAGAEGVEADEGG